MTEHPLSELSVTSAPMLELKSGRLGSKRWMQLLASLNTTHSITAAAKAVDLSYKAAWDAIDAMNNLSDEPLVLRSKGGKGGGGTELTPRGQQLVATYQAVESLNARFLKHINRRIGHLSLDMRLIERLNMLTSARNQFAGTVTHIQRGAVNDEIELSLPGGERVIAIVTRESTENLGLEVGVEAVALIKAAWVMIAIEGADQAMKLSASNQLRGNISRLTPGAVNTEVVVALKGGNSVAATIAKRAVEELGLVEGMPVTAFFKASSVILAVLT